MFACHRSQKIFKITSHRLCVIYNGIKFGHHRSQTIHLPQITDLGSDFSQVTGERGGSVVECRTPEREVRGSRPTVAVLCP